MIFSIIYNLLELLIIIMMGMYLGVPINEVVMLLLVFFVVRFTMGKPMHYKHWYRCALWSFSVFLGLFVVCKADIYVSVLATVFTGYVTSGKGNITDMFMWSKNSKYKLLDDFMIHGYNDPRLIQYEDYLKQREPQLFSVFQLRFRRNITNIDKLEEILNQDRKRIYSNLDIVYYSLKEKLMLYED